MEAVFCRRPSEGDTELQMAGKGSAQPRNLSLALLTGSLLTGALAVHMPVHPHFFYKVPESLRKERKRKRESVSLPPLGSSFPKAGKAFRPVLEKCDLPFSQSVDSLSWQAVPNICIRRLEGAFHHGGLVLFLVPIIPPH